MYMYINKSRFFVVKQEFRSRSYHCSLSAGFKVHVHEDSTYTYSDASMLHVHVHVHDAQVYHGSTVYIGVALVWPAL